MAKTPTFSPVTDREANASEINSAIQSVADQFEEVLFLDGETPNAMNADLDMNSNDILNAKTISTEQLLLDGSAITPTGLTASGASVVTDQFTGNGSTTSFTLSYAPAIKDHTSVFIDGVYQNKAGYSITSTTLTFDTAPPLNSAIEVQVFRSLLVGSTPATNVSYSQGGTGAIDRTAQVKLQEFVSIKDFGATGNGDAVVDTAALVAAVASGGRAVFFPKGLYLINFVNLPSDTMLWGEGAASVIRTPQAVRCAIGCDSGDPNLFIENITIKDLRLEGRVVQDGFSEQRHISSWNGAKNLLIDNCQFIGFQGDGVYIGMGNAGGQVRHNVNVTIRNCFFDGVNKDNRQGVSVIDCDGLLIEGCYFTRTTRSNMPGAIDIEPDGNVETVVRDIKIINNKFFDIGGNVACISVFLPNCENYTTPYQGFLIESNFIENTSKGIIYHPVMAAGATNAMHDQGVRIVNNITTNTGRSFEIYNAKGALVEGNQFIRGTASSLIGFTGSAAKSIDLTLRNNQFIESGYSSGDGLTIFNVERLTLEGNLFKDCGNGTAGNGDAISFSTNSSSSYVRIVNNIITSPNGNTLVAIEKEATHTFAPETNEFRGNTITVGGNSFQSIDNDAAETAYSPIVTGSSTAGTGTYTIQYGRWRRLGKLIFFRLKLTVDAGHTGTGMIQVTLPTLAVTAANNEETTVAVSVNGVATTGGQIGLINPGLNVGGVGAIRLYHTTTGSLAQTTIPAGAFTITASGFYQES